METPIPNETIELSGVLQVPKGSVLFSQAKQRQYTTHVRSFCEIRCVTSTAMRAINWLVGSRGSESLKVLDMASKKDGLLGVGSPMSAMAKETILKNLDTVDDVIDLAAQGKRIAFEPLKTPSLNSVYFGNSYKTNEALATQFGAAARKYFNYPVDYSFGDMAALIEQLARGLAYYSKYGYIDGYILSGGHKPVVLALGSSINEVHASAKTIFVSTGIEYLDTKHAFSAICWASAGARSIVVTDFVNVNMQTDRVLVPDAKGSQMARGIYEALHILGANMRDHDQGGTYALAITTGVHKELSVFSHSDEGSMFRKVLRQGNYAPSFGGISLNHRSYMGLPRPHDYSQTSVQHLVDTIALTTAAMVAISDPLIEKEGRYYPTISTVDKTLYEDLHEDVLGLPSEHNNEKKQFSSYHANNIARISHAFCANYIKNLCQLFGNHSSKTQNITNTLRDKFYLFSKSPDKQMLEYASVMPFFWIEPTCLISNRYNHMPAIMHGYGPVCYVDQDNIIPAFRGAKILNSNMVMSIMEVPWITARHHGLLMHLSAHTNDGLANMQFKSLDPEQLYFFRGDQRAKNKLDLQEHLGNYLWKRAHSDIIAPGEVLYTGKGVQVLLKHVMSRDGKTLEHTQLPYHDEIEGFGVTFRGTTIGASGLVYPSAVDKTVSHRRGRTLRAITKTLEYINKAELIIDETVSHRDIDIDMNMTFRPDIIGNLIRNQPEIALDDMYSTINPETLHETANELPATDIDRNRSSPILDDFSGSSQTYKAHPKGLQEPLRAPQINRQAQGAGAPNATRPDRPDSDDDDTRGGPSDSPPLP